MVPFLPLRAESREVSTGEGRKRLLTTLSDPTRGRVGLLAKNEIQLGGAVLDVAHVVQNEGSGGVVKPAKADALGSTLDGQGLDSCPALAAAMLVVSPFYLSFAVGYAGAGYGPILSAVNALAQKSGGPSLSSTLLLTGLRPRLRYAAIAHSS